MLETVIVIVMTWNFSEHSTKYSISQSSNDNRILCRQDKEYEILTIAEKGILELVKLHSLVAKCCKIRKI